MKNLFSLEQNDPISQMEIDRSGPNEWFYVGTFTKEFCKGPSNSSVYMHSKQKGVQRLFGSIQSTTGITIDRKRNKLYHLESCGRLIT